MSVILDIVVFILSFTINCSIHIIFDIYNKVNSLYLNVFGIANNNDNNGIKKIKFN